MTRSGDGTQFPVEDSTCHTCKSTLEERAMSRKSVMTLIAGILTLSVSVGFVAPLPVHAASCPPNSYTTTCKGCTKVPSHGSFSIGVPGVQTFLKGTGSASTHGTRICLTRVPAPKKSLGGVGVRVRANGKFHPLHLTKGTLYRFNPGTNKVTRVKTVKSSGIYQVVVH
jgi:hypothetical protein